MKEPTSLYQLLKRDYQTGAPARCTLWNGERFVEYTGVVVKVTRGGYVVIRLPDGEEKTAHAMNLKIIPN